MDAAASQPERAPGGPRPRPDLRRVRVPADELGSGDVSSADGLRGRMLPPAHDHCKLPQEQGLGLLIPPAAWGRRSPALLWRRVCVEQQTFPTRRSSDLRIEEQDVDKHIYAIMALWTQLQANLSERLEDRGRGQTFVEYAFLLTSSEVEMSLALTGFEGVCCHLLTTIVNCLKSKGSGC